MAQYCVAVTYYRYAPLPLLVLLAFENGSRGEARKLAQYCVAFGNASIVEILRKLLEKINSKKNELFFNSVLTNGKICCIIITDKGLDK